MTRPPCNQQYCILSFHFKNHLREKTQCDPFFFLFLSPSINQIGELRPYSLLAAWQKASRGEEDEGANKLFAELRFVRLPQRKILHNRD